MKAIFLMLVTVLLFGVSCERHDFDGPDGTKQLHQHHGDEHPDDTTAH